MAVITPGDRSDVVLAMASAHAAEGFPSLSCVILNGGLPLHPSIAKLVAGLGLRLPIVATDLGTYDTARAVAQARGRVTTTSQRKIDTALELMDDLRRHRRSHCAAVDSDPVRRDAADVHLSAAGPGALGPQAHRACRRATTTASSRRPGGCCSARWPTSPSSATSRRCGPAPPNSASTCRTPWCSNPQTSELCDQFAEQYAELRKHKGVTVEQAREIIHDVSYFGTMLVHNDMVDGMVSGARAHHRAHGPARVRDHQDAARCLDGVEHLPDVPGRRGAGVRRLRDRAGPDVGTARGHRDLVGPHRRPVRHRAAGGDAVVLDGHVGNRVPTSTRSGRQRNWCANAEPDLLVEGPIQYDAAVEPSVAATKMPDSKVAGRATVLIFPDLNTGNNTYKAVQRSAGAIAIGPGAAGAQQAGQRPVPGRARRGHREHRGDHRDPGAGQVTRTVRTVLVLNCGSSSVK